jgi:penicillin amidase
MRCSQLFSRRAVLASVALLAGFVVAALNGSALAAAAEPSSAIDADQLARSVTIYRDGFGVPHIDGPTDASVIFAFAYCQAEDYFWQVEDSFLMSLGRYAEVYGRTALPNDILVRSFEVTRNAQEVYPTLEPEVRQMCEAFVAGLNYYLAKHPEVEPRVITHFEPWFMLAANQGAVLELAMSHTGVSKDSASKYYEEIRAAKGSNAWAIGPSRTKSGAAMLFANPHQPYYGFGQFYEGHLRSGEGWNFSGATFFGSPVPTIGFNEHLGWSFTVNEPNIGDAWRVTFDDPQNPLNYRYDGGYREAVQWTETIKVKRLKRVDEMEYTFRKTHHGPIVKKLDDTTSLAVNLGRFGEAFLSRQNLKMVRARNLDEFREAMSMNEIPIFNTVYADKKGNIFYLYNGIIPRRDPQFDWNSPLDGSDPRTEWQGYLTMDEMPQVLNPPSGFIQNCNSTPYTTTDDGNPFLGDFPSYMLKDQYDDKRRAKVSRMLLREMHDITFDGWKTSAFDTTIYWALTELPKYQRKLAVLRETDPELAQKVTPYLEHMLDWDFRGSLDSTQTTLLMAWYEELYGFGYPAETLKGPFVGNPKTQFEALITAVEKLEKTFGKWQVAWGEVNRLQRHADVADFFKIPFSDSLPSLPSAGLHGPPGVAFTMYFSPSIEIPLVRSIKKHYAVVGASYQAVVEFGDKIQSGTLLQYGASGDPKSPHFFDQAELLSQQRFKPAPLYWDDVQAAAKRVYHPGEEVKGTEAQAGQ